MRATLTTILAVAVFSAGLIAVHSHMKAQSPARPYDSSQARQDAEDLIKGFIASKIYPQDRQDLYPALAYNTCDITFTTITEGTISCEAVSGTFQAVKSNGDADFTGPVAGQPISYKLNLEKSF
jgi:hypothetical protein